MKVTVMPLRNLPHWTFWAAVGLLATAAHAQVRRPAAAAPPAAPAEACVIAEFRRIAMTHHNPQERLDKALAWVQKNGPSCSPAQMSILISNRASLMGSADSSTLTAAFDYEMEKKLAKDPAALARFYLPVAQSPARRSEAGTPEATTAASPAPAGAAPGVAAAPAGLPAGAAVMAPAPVAGGGASAPVQNINVNIGSPKPPEEDLSRKLPLASEPLFAFPAEYGKPMLNYFGKLRRQMTRSFFMETLTPGKCPEGLTWRNDSCEALTKAAWRFGEKIPAGTKTFPVEPRLVEKLNFDPGYTFLRVGTDILALEKDTGKVADAVLNMGKAG